MLSNVKRLIVEEDGQGMTEYALVLGVIAIGAVAVIVLLRNEIENLYNKVVTELTKAGA